MILSVCHSEKASARQLDRCPIEEKRFMQSGRSPRQKRPQHEPVAQHGGPCTFDCATTIAEVVRFVSGIMERVRKVWRRIEVEAAVEHVAKSDQCMFYQIGARWRAFPFRLQPELIDCLVSPLRPVLKPVATTVPLHRRAIVGTSQCYYSAEQHYTRQTTLVTIALPFE